MRRLPLCKMHKNKMINSQILGHSLCVCVHLLCVFMYFRTLPIGAYSSNRKPIAFRPSLLILRCSSIRLYKTKNSTTAWVARSWPWIVGKRNVRNRLHFTGTISGRLVASFLMRSRMAIQVWISLFFRISSYWSAISPILQGSHNRFHAS